MLHACKPRQGKLRQEGLRAEASQQCIKDPASNKQKTTAKNYRLHIAEQFAHHSQSSLHSFRNIYRLPVLGAEETQECKLTELFALVKISCRQERQKINISLVDDVVCEKMFCPMVGGEQTLGTEACWDRSQGVRQGQ